MNLDPILRRLNLRQKDLAEELGVREEAVSRWANDHHMPDGRNLVALLAALQRRDPSITLADLTSDEVDTSEPASQLPTAQVPVATESAPAE